MAGWCPSPWVCRIGVSAWHGTFRPSVLPQASPREHRGLARIRHGLLRQLPLPLYGSDRTRRREDCYDSKDCKDHGTGASALCRPCSLLLSLRVAEVCPGALFPAPVPCENYACPYTPSPCLFPAKACGRLSRPPSTMSVSDSHSVTFPPPFLLYGKAPVVAPDCRAPDWVSRVPVTSLHTCHARSPRQVFEVSPRRPPAKMLHQC